jgi:opacity protein-like surface antigen
LEWLSFDLAVTNGEGIRFNQESFGNVKYAAGVDIKPLRGWTNRLYYDASPSDNQANPATRQLLSFFTGYRLPHKFRIGAEYNYYWNYANLDNNDLYGISVYGSYEMTERIELFARYDDLKSNTLSGTADPWHHSKDGQAYITGVHYIPVKNIALSLSYQGWKPDDNSQNYANTFALNFEFRL